MFEDEADTSPVGVEVYEATKPIELKASDTLRDISPLELIDVYDDTDAVIINARLASMSDGTTGVRAPRPSTNADWPPAPKQPANRKLRTAGMYNAISSITGLTRALKS